MTALVSGLVQFMADLSCDENANDSDFDLNTLAS
jgi:hypothetical protein